MDFTEGQPEPTNIRYYLKCLVDVKKVSYEDHQSDEKRTQRIEDDWAFLIPQEGTQKDKYLNAWMPITPLEQAPEAVIFIKHPVSEFCPIVIMMPNQNCRKPHMQIMNPVVINKLRHLNGKTVMVETMRDSEDALRDRAPAFELPTGVQSYKKPGVLQTAANEKLMKQIEAKRKMTPSMQPDGHPTSRPRPGKSVGKKAAAKIKATTPHPSSRPIPGNFKKTSK